MKPAWRIVLWATLAGLLAITVFSLFSRHLFQQEIWTETGRQHLGVYAGIYALWTLALRFFRTGIAVGATLALALLYSMAVTGPPASIAILFVLFCCGVLGLALMPSQHPEDIAIAIVAGLAIVVYIAGLAVHVRVNFWWTYLLFLTGIAAVCWRRSMRAASGVCWHAAKLRPGERVLIEILGFVLCAHLLVVLKPEVSSDGLAMHLVIAAQVSHYGLWDFNFRHVSWAVMPMAGDWAFTVAYLLGGEAAARLMNYATLLMTASLLYGIICKFASRTIAYISILLFVSSPLVQLVTGSLFVENVWTAFLIGGLAALIRFHETRKPVFMIASASLLGSACASKYGSLAFTIPAFLLGILELHRAGRRRLAVAAFGILVLFAAPPYVTAYVKTGNPVYPFMNTIFKSPWFDARTAFVDHRFQHPLCFDTLRQITFNTAQYLESQNGGLGFHYFLLVPLALLTMAKRWPYAAWIALAVGAIGFGLTFSTQANIRYCYPAAALMSIIIAAGFARLAEVHRPLYRAVLIISAGLIMLNLWFLPASGWYHKDFLINVLFNKNATESYLKESAPSRILIGDLNRLAPGEPVVLLETNAYAGLYATAYTNTWHHSEFVRSLSKIHSDIDCLRLMNGLRVHWFIAPAVESGTPIREEWMQSFLTEYTRPERTVDRFYLARLKTEYEGVDGIRRAEAAPKRIETVKRGTYDDFNRSIVFKGQWTRDRQFKSAYNTSLTYSDHPGDSSQLTFRGTEVRYMYTKANNRGIAEVFIDGRKKGAIDLYSSDVRWQQVTTYNGLPIGTHVLEIRVSSRKNAASTGNFVDLDGITIR